MDRLLFGDNQFFGINHMSEEKARAQSMRFSDAQSIIDVLDIAADGMSATRTTVSLPIPAGRFRSVVQGPDGNLYIAVDQGEIYQFKPN